MLAASGQYQSSYGTLRHVYSSNITSWLLQKKTNNHSLESSSTQSPWPNQCLSIIYGVLRKMGYYSTQFINCIDGFQYFFSKIPSVIDTNILQSFIILWKQISLYQYGTKPAEVIDGIKCKHFIVINVKHGIWMNECKLTNLYVTIKWNSHIIFFEMLEYKI